jgi:Trk-type K+ transport system membrane component
MTRKATSAAPIIGGINPVFRESDKPQARSSRHTTEQSGLREVSSRTFSEALLYSLIASAVVTIVALIVTSRASNGVRIGVAMALFVLSGIAGGSMLRAAEKRRKR